MRNFPNLDEDGRSTPFLQVRVGGSEGVGVERLLREFYGRVKGGCVVTARLQSRSDFGFRPCEGAHQRAYPLP